MTKISEPIIELQVAVVSTLRNYLIFPKYAFLISVLISSLSLAKMSVILITYITDTRPDIGLLNAALIVNFEEGFTGVMILVLSHIASAYSGPFKMVLLSTVAYVIGLILLWRELNLYVAVLLIAVGKAGVMPLLKEFLAAQLRNRDEDQVKGRADFWWGFWYLLGSLGATFGIVRVYYWSGILEITAILMGVALVIFMAGFTFYQHEPPIRSPLITTIYRVMKVAISKRHLPYPDDVNAYFMNNNNGVQLLPLFLRWLDKAAIIRTGISPEEQERNGELCSVTDVNEVKLLLRMIPMWATFSVYCLISATGSTFFFEQATNLDDPIGNNFKIDNYAFFRLVQLLSSYAISYLYPLIIEKWWPNHVRRTRLRFILGMLCSLCSCIAARFVEVRRLKLVTLKGYLDNKDEIIPMSAFCLIPQFCFLGFSDGLVQDEFLEFFYDQVGESMKIYGPVFRESVLGIGKFISIFWILIFSSWFGSTMNHSHLDNYYAILAILVMGNLYFFGCVSNRYIFMGAGGQLEANSETIPQSTLDLFTYIVHH